METYDIRQFGADPTGAVSANTAIAAALAAAEGEPVYIVAGRYLLDSPIAPSAAFKLHGDRSGTLVPAPGALSDRYVIEHAGSSDAPTDGIEIVGIGFDGLVDYPADTTVARDALSHYRGAISLLHVKNTLIERNIVKGFTLNGVRVGGVGENNRTHYNYFEDAAYNGKVIVYTSSPAHAHKNGSIVGNTSLRNGPTRFADASHETFASSVDGIHADDIDGVVIRGNTVRFVSGVGIRIEGCLRFSCWDNTVDDAGAYAISAYNTSKDGSILLNRIARWGRLPRAASFVRHEGTVYVCRETPHLTENPLPADPATVAWFEECPYSLEGIENIRDYDDADYDLLPFRGFGGISIAGNSSRIDVRRNTIRGDLSTDAAGALTHAADFGITPVHNVNHPISGTQQAADTWLSDNEFFDLTTEIYWPDYTDPVAQRGPVAARPDRFRQPVIAICTAAARADVNAVWEALGRGVDNFSRSLCAVGTSTPVTHYLMQDLSPTTWEASEWQALADETLTVHLLSSEQSIDDWRSGILADAGLRLL